jgi:DNA-binding SARP family transcriptional activator
VQPLVIVTFGRFEVRQGGAPVRLCSSRSGQTILRYLTTHPHHRESADALMELLWPEDPPKAARHKLHCAFSALRASLHAGGSVDHGPYVRFADGFYELTPDIGTTIDVDALFRAYRAGQRLPADEAARQYEAACSLAAGTFLPDDAYADWAIARREAVAGALRSMQHMLAAHTLASGRTDEARSWCQRLLGDNRTDEAAYRILMQAEVAAGRRGEALRQYQACVRALRDDLGIEPMAETTALFEAIVRGTAG